MGIPRFRQLPHTADVRLAIYGRTEEELLLHLALGLGRLVLGHTPSGKPQRETIVRFGTEELGPRLVRFGNEVLFWLFTRHCVTIGVRFKGDEVVLALRALSSREKPLFEVKAVTAHALAPQKLAGRYKAVITLDL
ncbi:MAG: archease [Thermoanaerobaculaceae bacterium]